MEPTPEQLRTFYRVVRQAVLFSSYIAFVELGEDGNLYIHIGRYESQEISIYCITVTGGITSDE